MTSCQQMIAIGRLGRVITGKTPPSTDPEYFGNKYPFITPTDLDEDSMFVATERFLSEKGMRDFSNYAIPPHSVCFTCIGATIGKMCFTRRFSFTNQQINSVIVDSSIHDSQFVYYLLKQEKDRIRGFAGGAATPIISKSIFSQIEVPFLPLIHQQRIAAILSAYDDLIENNTRRIRILEEMAHTIYREWFVNFRFPGHQKVKMVNSSIGKIPEEWDVGRLDDALILQRGFDLPNKDRTEGNIPVYAATGIVGCHGEAKVRGPCVVTGRSGSLGTVMYVETDFWPLNTTLWVKEFRRTTPLHAFYLLQDLDLVQFNSGAAVPTLNRNDVHGLPIALPSTKCLSLFDELVLPMRRIIQLLSRKNDTLRQTRNLLLPKLILGEVDVSELDIQTAGTASN